MAFDYLLPREKIAQRPPEVRGSSRMLVATHDYPRTPSRDCLIGDLPHFLSSGDVIVFNNSRVLPCRFFAKKENSGADIEVLLIRPEAGENDVWRALARPMKRLKPGTRLTLSRSLLGDVIGRTGENEEFIQIRIHSNMDADVLGIIEEEGSMPIPGYIRDGQADDLDRSRYQTVFCRETGSIAAPTAGLHFTPELLTELRANDVTICEITLHVGVASFLPVRDASRHRMPTEWYRIPRETRKAIVSAKGRGKRVLAVGTTTVRSLESDALVGSAVGDKELRATELFITPGFRFQVVDSILTNFHQPETSHLFLVSAFLDVERVRSLYAHALDSSYRFLSYGDCMLLL